MPLYLLTYLSVCYISVLTLIYFIFIDKSFKDKHPILFTLLVITCIILIFICSFMIVKFTSIIIKDIKSYLLNMNTSGDSSNNPQGSYNPSGSTGSGGGYNQPGGDGNTNIPHTETPEEKKRRLNRERCKRYRDKKPEAVKRTTKKYRDTHKGRNNEN